MARPTLVSLLACLLVTCCLPWPSTQGQVLFFNNTQSAFAQVDGWIGGEDEISFSFSTRVGRGLLLHAENPAWYVQLSIHGDGIECSAAPATAGFVPTVKFLVALRDSRSSVTDGKEHTVSLSRSAVNEGRDVRLTLSVDSRVSQSAILSDAWRDTQGPQRTFLAGPPPTLLPSHLSATIPRFIGCVRAYAIGGSERPSLLQTAAMDRLSHCPVCVEESTCSHNGRCRPDGVSGCDCRGTGYDGRRCDEPSPVISLDGAGCLEFSFDALSLLRTIVSFSIRFRSSSSGLLLLTERLQVRLENGSAHVEFVPQPQYRLLVGDGLLADGVEWHFVEVSLLPSEMTVVLNKAVTKSVAFAANSVAKSMDFTTSFLNVGCSSPRTDLLVGCIQDVYAGETGMLRLSRSPAQQVATGTQVKSSASGVSDACPAAADFSAASPLTIAQQSRDGAAPGGLFTMSSSVYANMSRRAVQYQANHDVRFWFRTQETDAGLLETAGMPVRFTLALRCRRVVLDVVDTTAPEVAKMAVHSVLPVADGRWQRVRIQFLLRRCAVSLHVAGMAQTLSLHTNATHCLLDKNSEYVYSFGRVSSADEPRPGPAYRGCVALFAVDGTPLSLRHVESQNGVSPGCTGPGASSCTDMACMNSGVCTEGWMRHSCDCAKTQFTGDACEIASPVLTFPGAPLTVDTDICADCTDRSTAVHCRGRVLWSAHVRPHRLTGVLAGSSWMLLSLVDGRLGLNLTTSTGVRSLVARRTLLEVDMWYRVRVAMYDCSGVHLDIDGQGATLERLDSNETMCPTSRRLSVGELRTGDARADRTQQDVSLPPFSGCMKKITVADKPLNAADVGGRPVTDRCAPSSPPCSSGPNSSFTLPLVWPSPELERTRSAMRYAFDWRTLQRHRVSLYFATRRPWATIISSGLNRSSNIQVALHDLHLCLYVKTPSAKSYRSNCSAKVYGDGVARTIQLSSLSDNSIAVKIEDETIAVTFMGGGDLSVFGSDIFIAGSHCGGSEVLPVTRAPGLVGCIGNVTLGRECVDDLLATTLCPGDSPRFVPGLGRAGGESPPASLHNAAIAQCAGGDLCKLSPCRHKGVCTATVSSRICNCVGTGHVGETCSKAAATATLNSTSSTLGVFFKSMPLRDLHVRFTSVPTGGRHGSAAMEILAAVDRAGLAGVWLYGTDRGSKVAVVMRTGNGTVHSCKASLETGKSAQEHTVHIKLHPHRHDVKIVVDGKQSTCRTNSPALLSSTRLQVGRLPPALRRIRASTGFRGWLKELYVNNMRPLDILSGTSAEDRMRGTLTGVRIKTYQVALKQVSIPFVEPGCLSDDEDCHHSSGFFGSGSPKPTTTTTTTTTTTVGGQGQTATEMASPTRDPIAKISTSECRKLANGSCDENLGVGESSSGLSAGATIGIIIFSVIVGVVLGVAAVFVIAKLLSAQRGEFELNDSPAECKSPDSKSPDSKYSSGEHFL